MNCPLCGAHSYVLDTRRHGELTVRRRECANEHRFKSVEIFPTMLNPGTRDRALATITRARSKWERDEAIRKDSRPKREVAHAHGLSVKRVQDIKSRRISK